MKRELVSLALCELDERYISETETFSPAAARGFPERTVLMKRKRILTLVLAAALILALGVTVYAASGLGMIASHRMPETGEYTDLASLPQIEKTVGYPVTVPERFSDGYAFSYLRVRGEAEFSETGETEREFYGVHALYTKPGEADCWLDLAPFLAPTATGPSERRTLGGVEVTFSFDHYKVVPEDYEKTEADLAREAEGHYYISFGSDGIEEYDFAFASFVLGSVEYVLTDTAASGDSFDQLAQMALELIAAAEN